MGKIQNVLRNLGSRIKDYQNNATTEKKIMGSLFGLGALFTSNEIADAIIGKSIFKVITGNVGDAYEPSSKESSNRSNESCASQSLPKEPEELLKHDDYQKYSAVFNPHGQEVSDSSLQKAIDNPEEIKKQLDEKSSNGLSFYEANLELNNIVKELRDKFNDDPFTNPLISWDGAKGSPMPSSEVLKFLVANKTEYSQLYIRYTKAQDAITEMEKKYPDIRENAVALTRYYYMDAIYEIIR